MSNDWFYDYFINELKAIRRNPISKPLTYDYMPEGYPSKSVQTTTLMEEQRLSFEYRDNLYIATLPVSIDLVEGQTYVVTFDGIIYKCLCKLNRNVEYIGSDQNEYGGLVGDEPFCVSNGFVAARCDVYLGLYTEHTIGIITVVETITPMAEEFMSQTPIFYFTFDDSVRCQTLYNEDETLVTIEQIRAVGINAILYDTSASAYYRPVSFNSHGDSAYYYIAKGNYAPEKVFYRAGFFKGVS